MWPPGCRDDTPRPTTDRPPAVHPIANHPTESEGSRLPSSVDIRRAAESLGMSPRTLEKWRVEGNGPPFLKLGRRVRYSVVDLESWIRTRRRQSTSED